jgi:hypothetical protein
MLEQSFKEFYLLREAAGQPTVTSTSTTTTSTGANTSPGGNAPANNANQNQQTQQQQNQQQTQPQQPQQQTNNKNTMIDWFDAVAKQEKDKLLKFLNMSSDEVFKPGTTTLQQTPQNIVAAVQKMVTTRGGYVSALEPYVKQKGNYLAFIDVCLAVKADNTITLDKIIKGKTPYRSDLNTYVPLSNITVEIRNKINKDAEQLKWPAIQKAIIQRKDNLLTGTQYILALLSKSRLTFAAMDSANIRLPSFVNMFLTGKLEGFLSDFNSTKRSGFVGDKYGIDTEDLYRLAKAIQNFYKSECDKAIAIATSATSAQTTPPADSSSTSTPPADSSSTSTPQPADRDVEYEVTDPNMSSFLHNLVDGFSVLEMDYNKRQKDWITHEVDVNKMDSKGDYTLANIMKMTDDPLAKEIIDQFKFLSARVDLDKKSKRVEGAAEIASTLNQGMVKQRGA